MTKDIGSDEVTEKYKYSSRKINNGNRIAFNVISSSSSSSHPASDEGHLRAAPVESEIKQGKRRERNLKTEEKE